MGIIGGPEKLNLLKQLMLQKPLTTAVIRQLFFLDTMKEVKRLLPADLGIIASHGKNLCPQGDFRDETLGFGGGDRGYWDVPLSSLDSGGVLLQKIATASVLSEIISILSVYDQDQDSEYWMPFEIFPKFFGGTTPTTDYEEIQELKKEMSWN